MLLALNTKGFFWLFWLLLPLEKLKLALDTSVTGMFRGDFRVPVTALTTFLADAIVDWTLDLGPGVKAAIRSFFLSKYWFKVSILRNCLACNLAKSGTFLGRGMPVLALAFVIDPGVPTS